MQEPVPGKEYVVVSSDLAIGADEMVLNIRGSASAILTIDELSSEFFDALFYDQTAHQERAQSTIRGSFINAALDRLRGKITFVESAVSTLEDAARAEGWRLGRDNKKSPGLAVIRAAANAFYEYIETLSREEPEIRYAAIHGQGAGRHVVFVALTPSAAMSYATSGLPNSHPIRQYMPLEATDTPEEERVALAVGSVVLAIRRRAYQPPSRAPTLRESLRGTRRFGFVRE
ncbi:DNA-binding protein [Pseudomonas phage BHU-1]|nr:DNA-binding protein [Pseudomonas phage BHU-1]UGV20005.1 DNA-binding protein [Pseudomonas phage Pa BHU-15]UIW13561.1 DNA-binding protein [Pseudomonas phage Pa BHU-17]